MPRIDFAFLAEAASAGEHGLVSALGIGIDTTLSPVVPLSARRTLVVRLLWDLEEVGNTHDVSVRFSRIGADQPPTELGMTLEVERSNFDEELDVGLASNLIMELPIVFTEYAIYFIEFLLDEEVWWSRRYRIGPIDFRTS